MTLLTYVAKYGDYLVGIADRHGTTWQEIWNHPLNAEHRQKRVSPDILYPGDVLHVPAVVSPGPLGPAAPQPAQPPPSLDVPPPWPYPPPPPRLGLPSVPTWVCPEGTCNCAGGHAKVDPVKHTVFLFDEQSRRIPHAQCRVHVSGAELPSPTVADGSGAITFEVSPTLTSVIIEWAPHDVPTRATLPFRRLYHLDPGGPDREGVRRRLHHVGVSGGHFLEEQIRDFQEAYGLPVDGQVASVAGPLLAYHDGALLPPLDHRHAPLAPEPHGPHQGAVSGVSLSACHVSLQLLDSRNEPIAGAPFVLAIGAGRVFEGITDAEGRLEFGQVEAGDYPLQVAGQSGHVPAIRTTEHHRPIVFSGGRSS